MSYNYHTFSFQPPPPLPEVPPPEGSGSTPETPELLSPDSGDAGDLQRAVPPSGLAGLDMQGEVESSGSESVTPDMDSQVLFIKLKEVWNNSFLSNLELVHICTSFKNNFLMKP